MRFYSLACARFRLIRHRKNTKEELIAQLPALLKQGDNILVKASHAMEFPKVIEAITEMTQE